MEFAMLPRSVCVVFASMCVFCQAVYDPMLLIGQEHGMSALLLDNLDPNNKEWVQGIDGYSNMRAVDFDVASGFVYWSDYLVDEIARAPLNMSDVEYVVPLGSDNWPRGVAVDWVARNLYWTNDGKRSIGVSRLDGSSMRDVITTGISSPKHIRLDPENGYMYWVDFGETRKIERAYLDGSGRQTLVEGSRDSRDIVGLDLDLDHRKIYWGDAASETIEVADMDGGNRATAVSVQIRYIYDMAVLGDYIYWIDKYSYRYRLKWANRFTGEVKTELVTHWNALCSLKAIGPESQLGTNACAMNNGGCSHLCFYRPPPFGIICACPNGQNLDSSGRNCIEAAGSLLIASPTSLSIFSLDSPSATSQPIPIQGLDTVKAVDYKMENDVDFLRGQIFWTDVGKKEIKTALLDGSSLRTIVNSSLIFPESLAVDSAALNIYWGDTGKNQIEVSSWDGKSRKIIVWKDMVSPKRLVVDPFHRYLFWTDGSTVERSHLDGSNKTVIGSNLGDVTDLAVDLQADGRLYWLDGRGHSIKSMDVNGNTQAVVVYPLGYDAARISVYGGFVYWTDRYSGVLYRTNKHGGDIIDTFQTNVATTEAIDVKYIPQGRLALPRDNPCIPGSMGKCWDLCLAQPNATSDDHPSRCACPTHYTLDENNERSCRAPKNFLLVSTETGLYRLNMESENGPVLFEALPSTLDVTKSGPLRLIGVDEHEYPDFYSRYWVQALNHTPQRIQSDRVDWTFNRYFLGDATTSKADGVGFDMYTRTMYWTNSTTGLIYARQMVAGSPRSPIQVSPLSFKPTSIVVYPEIGMMFFVNMLQPPKIEKSRMDGSDYVTIVEGSLGRPHSLVVDKEGGRLFWADDSLGKIQVTNLDGSNRDVVVDSEDMEIGGMAIQGDYLYWVEKRTNTVERINKDTFDDRDSFQGPASGLYDILAVNRTINVRAHPCFRRNGYCSHICLIGDDGDKQCSCPMGMYLTLNYWNEGRCR